jgi:hypothetical protein
MAKTKKIKEALQSTLMGGDAMQRKKRKQKNLEPVVDLLNKNKKKRNMPKIGR